MRTLLKHPDHKYPSQLPSQDPGQISTTKAWAWGSLCLHKIVPSANPQKHLSWENFALKSYTPWGMYIFDFKTLNFPDPFLRVTVGGITKCSNTWKSGWTAVCSEEGNILKCLSTVWSCQITSVVWSYKTGVKIGSTPWKLWMITFCNTIFEKKAASNGVNKCRVFSSLTWFCISVAHSLLAILQKLLANVLFHQHLVSLWMMSKFSYISCVFCKVCSL